MIINKIIRKYCEFYHEQKWIQIRNKTVIDSRSYFFESYSANSFQGNLYYIYKWMFHEDRFLNAIFYIASKDIIATENWLMQKGLYDRRTKVVRYLSTEYIFALYTSRYIFNNVSFPMYFVKKDKQIYINTWHGTPLKFIGKRAGSNPLDVQNMQRDFLSCDYLLSPNHSTTEIYENDFNIKGLMVNDILEIGYPRNEIFYNTNYRNMERASLGIDDKIVVFYMPTWRSSKSTSYCYPEKMEELAKRLGPKYIIYVKLHPLDQIGKHTLSKIRYMPEEYEVYEFLQCCDVLITDYSSVMFDFANTGRKVILYQFDRFDYYNERGIYQNIAKKIPFPVVETLEEVEDQIKAGTIPYNNFADLFCRNDKEGSICKLFAILERENVGVIKECDLRIVKGRDEVNIAVNSKMKRILYLIPDKKNGFFAQCRGLENAFFIVGSDNGHYTIKEYLLILLSKVIRFPRLHSYVESIYARERKRMLGQLKIKSIISSSSMPKYFNIPIGRKVL